MTNRLPKQEPEVVDVQTFMERNLAQFIKDRMAEGMSKKMAIQWATDRFEKGGKYNLEKVPSAFLKQDKVSGRITAFMYEEGQVYQVANAEALVTAMVTIRNSYPWEDFGAWENLEEKVDALSGCDVIMIWRMYTGMNDVISGGVKMISYVGGQSTDDGGENGNLTGDHTGVLLVSLFNLLVQHDVLDFVGQAA